MAYITRYIFGTDKLRPNAFEVRGMNGSNTGVIQCSDLAVLSHWIKLVSEYITALTSQKVYNHFYLPLYTNTNHAIPSNIYYMHTRHPSIGCNTQQRRPWPYRANILHELGGRRCAKYQPAMAKLEAQVLCAERR